MLSDGTYSFIHFTNPSQSLYMEKWTDDDPIPYDDIDTSNLFEVTANLFPPYLLEEDEDGAIPINSTNFNSKYYKNKKKDRIWVDTEAIDKFLREPGPGDKTILKPINSKGVESDFTIGQFLMNGYGPNDFDLLNSDSVNDSINNSDLSIEFPQPFRRTSNSNPNQTPRIRPRQASNDRSYHTPVTRVRRNFSES